MTKITFLTHNQHNVCFQDDDKGGLVVGHGIPRLGLGLRPYFHLGQEYIRDRPRARSRQGIYELLLLNLIVYTPRTFPFSNNDMGSTNLIAISPNKVRVY